MARKVRTSKTPEQRKAEAEALHATIATEVENLRDSTNWTRFLDFSRHMNGYSINNLLLILAQNPDATAVAGYRTWQDRGYQVRKGEKAIRIFGGRSVTETVEDPATGEETEQRRTLFFAVPVFDITQCDPIDPENAITPAGPVRLDGEDPAGIYDAVVDYLTSQGWTVTREAIPGETNGLTSMDDSRRVVVDSGLSPAMSAKVALHEAAHATLHAEDGIEDYVAHRGLKETEAESVAYVTAGLLGLDTAEYSIGYVAGWSDCDPQLIKDTADRVLRCAHTLADALTSDAAAGAVEEPATPTVQHERTAEPVAVATAPHAAAMADTSLGQESHQPPGRPTTPATTDDVAEALATHLTTHARELAEAVVYLGANTRWGSSAIEVLAEPIQRAAVDAGMPAFGSTGANGEAHAFYGRLAQAAGVDTDWDAEPDPSPSPVSDVGWSLEP
ncbi:ArdC family protein [Isoptericola sp. S6320L]|uniref:ArdC family protein n=1 Tax=Isoptericola sp. S6320L TaxID=2926411 RepID=UPI001FF31B25|nr:ArdC family protein [Isoptericola sp. S6320L]MCK0117002.1 ArdC family protein [Isoptericola sp. S6320L]